MSFANDILDAIEIMVKQVVEDNATKIYTGVCKTTGVNNCVLTINGKDNTVKYYGGVPVVGTVYQVFIPFGNMSAAFIIVPGSGGGSGGSGVDSVNGKTGDVVLNAADVGALPTSGGTLTGKLTVGSASINTNGYVVGTWLQGTATNHLTNAATKIAVQDGSGWVYHRTAEEIKSDIGLSNVDNVKQYSASNPPPYPVTSVNAKTGKVTLTASDVGAYPNGIKGAVNCDDLSDGTWTISASGTNGPGAFACTLFHKDWNADFASQFAFGANHNVYYRVKTGGSWLAWQEMYSTLRYPSPSKIGLGNVDNIKQYSEINPPPYPVVSVNGKTGGVNLVASDVGAVSTDNITQTLGTSTTKVPSEKAVTDAMGAAGYGDMLKSVYDATGAIANGGGIVDYIESKILDATDIIVSDTQPSGQAIGGFWYQIT